MPLALILTTVLACVLWLQAPADVSAPVGARLLLTGLLGLAVVGLAWVVTRCTQRRAAEADSGNLAERYLARGKWLHLAAHVMYIGLAYRGLDYASIVKSCERLSHLVLVDDLVALMPLILPLLASWAVFAEFEQSGASWCRASWWSRQVSRTRIAILYARHYLLLPLTPILVLLAAHDVLRLFLPVGLQRAEGPLMLMCLVGLSLWLPWLLRLIWPTRPLPEGGQRRQVEAVLRRAGLRISGVLVWQTENRIVNAATTGVLPGCRYLLLSDGLIRRLEDGQLSAIVAHEVGHLRHRHAAKLLLSLAIPLLAVLVQQLLLERVGVAHSVKAWGAAFVLLFWFVVHGRWARLLEHQADVTACHLISAEPHLRPEAVAVYSDALRATANGASASDWLHPTIGSRIALLHYLLRQPNRELDFQRHVRYVTRLLTTLALLLLGCWALWA